MLFRNKICVGFVNNEMANLLLSRVVARDNSFHPKQAVHMFTKNSSAVDHNNFMLNGTKRAINTIDNIHHKFQLLDKQLDTFRAWKIEEVF